MKIKLFDPQIGKEEENAVNKVLKSKYWASGAGSKNVVDFENEFKKYVGSKECIAVNSGTAALNLAMSLINIKNKEVIVPSLTFVSTVNAVLFNGGKPVFADINPETLCIDKETINKKITKKTKAILPVHFGGMPCKLNDIEKIAKKHDLFVIEDAAHATGAEFKRKKIGSHSTAVCFSFHPVKNIAMPTGGIIAINHEESKKMKNQLQERRWCGIKNRTFDAYEISELGNNYYMNEFSAAIGRIQLRKLEKMNNKRKKIAKIYCDEIKIDEKMKFSKDCAYHLFWIRVKSRNKLRKILLKNGIETGIHYAPVHKFELYDKKIELEFTEKVSNEIITIPMHPNLKESEISKVIQCINNNL